jgi:hypothetical protein
MPLQTPNCEMKRGGEAFMLAVKEPLKLPFLAPLARRAQS